MNDELDCAPFEPVLILPSQVATDAQWVSETTGPIGLMLAVVEEAARCIERGRRRRHPASRKLAGEAEAWIRSDSREWPFAFANICDVLGVDPDAARARLLAPANYPNGGRRMPVWHIPRGPGRTSVRPALAAPRAA